MLTHRTKAPWPLAFFLSLLSAQLALAAPPAAVEVPKLIAETYDSGFAAAHDTYNGMIAASDGRIYYVLSSQAYDVAGQMYCFDPATRAIRHVGDLTEACGEQGMQAVAQGKSHVNFVEAAGKLYFATHSGYYAIVDGMEKMGPPPTGWKAYPGGHFLAYDLAAGRFENLAVAPRGEGILAMNMDRSAAACTGSPGPPATSCATTWPNAN